MNIILVAVNASFSHTCLSVRQLSAYADVPFVEFTINQPVGEILRGIRDSVFENKTFDNNPVMVLFSTYIWNAQIIERIIPDIKKIIPEAIVGAGGPEFGFAPEVYFKKLQTLDLIMKGEGEEQIAELKRLNSFNMNELKSIKGLYYRNDIDSYKFSGERELICNLNDLPFAYPELKEAEKNNAAIPESLRNKIFYYESSRGCPFMCSYCMSSLDVRVRYMPLERVFEDIQTFLNVNAPLVKFVDRTYNLQEERYIAIWKYIKEHHNGITMFHFEIEAEFLSKAALDFLQSMPSGIMQFEIGVQSSNKKTLEAIQRSQNIEKLAENISQLPRSIHQHLDLIAGLPFEDLNSFGNSFDFVMALKPDALQLGFLKVLHGTVMEKFAKENGWQWMENPVYETFSTPYMSYEDMMFLKDLEILVDAYWNSGVFSSFMNYVGRNISWWEFFVRCTREAENKKTFTAARRESYWFELMFIFINENVFPEFSKDIGIDLLKYDFIRRGKQGNFPAWYKHNYDKLRHRILLEEKEGFENARIGFAYSEYEVFGCNVTALEPEKEPGSFELLIQYKKRI